MNKDPTQTCSWVIFFICLGGEKQKEVWLVTSCAPLWKKIDEKKTITLLASAPKRNMKVEVWENRIGVMDGLYC